MAVSAARPLATTATSRRPPLWLLLGLSLAVVTLLPYAFAHLAHPPGQTFMGFFFLGDDANTYLAKMREGLDGSWVWTNKYTTEPSTPVYFFVFWIALGHLAGLLHLPVLLMFHLARLAGAIILLYAGWVFIEYFVVDAGAGGGRSCSRPSALAWAYGTQPTANRCSSASRPTPSTGGCRS